MNRVRRSSASSRHQEGDQGRADRHGQARRHHHRSGEVFLVMSDQLNISKSQPKLRLAAQGDRVHRRPGPGGSPCRWPPCRRRSIRRADAHLIDYVKVVYKRRWTAATAFLLVVGGVTVYTFTATPIFEARTRLLIEAENQNVVNFKEVIDEDQGPRPTTTRRSTTSCRAARWRARRSTSLKLWDTRRSAATAPSWFSVGRLPAPPGDRRRSRRRRPDGRRRRDRRAVDGDRRLPSHLAVTPIRNSRLVDVSYRLADAALPRRIVNALAKNYIEQNLEHKFVASKEASDWLGERLAEQRKAGGGGRSALQRVSRAERRHLARGPREHRRPEAGRPERRGHAGEDRADPEGGDVQAAPGVADNPAALDTFPAILGNTFIQQQKAELASCSAAARSCRRSSARSTRT